MGEALKTSKDFVHWKILHLIHQSTNLAVHCFVENFCEMRLKRETCLGAYEGAGGEGLMAC